jgi:ABC-type uncharacterized transport system substrate-binding protein
MILRGIPALFILFFITLSPVHGEMKKVLIIESYHPVLAWTDQCEQGIADVLGKEFSISSFYMDTKRIKEDEFQDRAEKAWKIFKERKPDLVMIGDDNALMLLGTKLAETKTPVVYFGINDNPRRYFKEVPENITGVLERTPVIPWARHIKQIIPWAEKALVLMDDSLTSEAIRDIVFSDKKKMTLSGITLEYQFAGKIDEWERIVKNAKKYDFILMPTFHAVKDRKGKAVSVEDVVAWTSANSPVPVFSNQDYTVGDNGVIGAFVIFGKHHGKLAGEMALEILKNKKNRR